MAPYAEESSAPAQSATSRNTPAVCHPRVLCVGDSLTAGLINPGQYHPYAVSLAQELGVPVDQIGLSGAKTDEMVANISNPVCTDIFGKHAAGLLVQLSKGEYTVCAIMAGTNDVNLGCPAGSILANVITLHETCLAKGLRTIALPIPESKFILSPESTLQAGERQKFNSLLKHWASRQSGKVKWVNMASQVPYSGINGDWVQDGLHMTTQGYSRFGRRLSRQVRGFVLEAQTDKGQLPTSSHVLYKRTTGEMVPATVVGPSPKGPEFIAIDYDIAGQLMRNMFAPLAAVTPVREASRAPPEASMDRVM